MKALRRASVGHFMGKHYNDFLADMKGKYQQGDHSDLWQMVRDRVYISSFELPTQLARRKLGDRDLALEILAAARPFLTPPSLGTNQSRDGNKWASLFRTSWQSCSCEENQRCSVSRLVWSELTEPQVHDFWRPNSR